MMRFARTCKVVLVGLALFLVPLTGVYAETKVIIAEGMYIMGEGETPGVAQERAILDAKRLAVDQAGTFLESYSMVKDMQLVKDDIRVVAAEVIETTVIDNKREILDGEATKF